jgi:phosphatidylinositol glycan class B
LIMSEQVVRINPGKLKLDERMIALIILAVSVIAGFVIRVFIVFGDEGMYWPDEIYQSFEPAHNLVFGYGLMPWEYIQGARSWALPGFVAIILKLCALFGGDSPLVYIRVTKLVFALASVCTGIGVYRLAKLYGAKEILASVSTACFVLCGLCLYFSHRAMSENATALPVVWGLVFALDKSARARRLVIGASLLGISVLFRIQSSLFCVCALAIILCRRECKRALIAFATMLLWAVVYGALDAVTWGGTAGAVAGGWFHSVVVYIRFNVVEQQGGAWGISPWWYYFRYLWSSMPTIVPLFALGLVCAMRRATGLVLTILFFLAIHSLIPHKELRFIVPALPLFCACLGIGLSELPGILTRRIAASLVFAAVLVSSVVSRTYTFGDIGAYLERPDDPAWGDGGSVNRLLLEASKRKDLCGLAVAADIAWTGGLSYLHINAPIYSSFANPDEAKYNYAIVRDGTWDQVIAVDNGLMLVKIRDTGCERDYNYRWEL